ncbi:MULTISPECIES: PqqD family protein [Priestia]|uniref:PqqD family protein n=1 Tax=Priestia aryabhattai TaxID=412384 RepID=A0ABD5KV21_PRIAR|nr:MULTISPECIES: PqqD family protein [Priestia]MBK0292132.1 PqqD family protein [Bacillus sp. S34]UPK48058.1 PqqD family protein [Bacillus sp. H8-1]MDC7764065.1 PqqD family protein [Priestia aryabhattai]MED3960147.1 PqqD family protein [Priestia aryabhattai]MED3992975.1 PqqD family protein [Priestia aryabhattai]
MTSYIQKGGYEVMEVDSEWVVLNPQAYTVTTLNEVGGYCWKVIENKKTLAEIIKAVAAYYNTEAELIKGDIQHFLNKLIDCGLVEQYAS